MPATNLREELLALLAKEAEYASPRPPPANPQGGFDGRGLLASGQDSRMASIRQQVCQWNYDSVDYFLVNREVVHLSMNYFDRYLAARRGERGDGGDGEGEVSPTTETVHLLALASLYVACKRQGTAAASSHDKEEDEEGPYCERASAKFRVKDFCKLSGGAYAPRMIEGMELMLLASLRWRLHPPTPMDFVYQFAKLLWLSLQDNNQEDCPEQGGSHAGGHNVIGEGGWSVFELARYQIELAVYSPELCQACPPSAVALASVLNATDSRIAGTDRTAVSAHVRHSFLHRLRCLGERFQEDHMVVSVQQARMVLATLCPKIIALPRQEAGKVPSLLEYELPKDQLLADESISPVGVDSDLV